jgi:hypothetical protein
MTKPRRLVECNYEELEELIEFHLTTADDARDSCDHDEAEWRNRRAGQLLVLLQSCEAAMEKKDAPTRSIDCDDEELQVLVDLHVTATFNARESCDYEEAARQSRRAEVLNQLLHSS